MQELIFATRPSALARWQTHYIAKKLGQSWEGLVCEERVITTKGDKVLDKPLPEIGGKGLFTYELEQALLSGDVHAAVHSLKDLPTDHPAGLTIGAIPERGDFHDVLISPAGFTLEQLPPGAVVGTSSTRRKAQLLAHRPDLQIQPIRGNVDTRIRKAQGGQYEAIILAEAGVTRLGLDHMITQRLPLEIMLSAPGQGALAVQCRDDDTNTLQILNTIEHTDTRKSVEAERAFLETLGGGCSLPVGAFAAVVGSEIHLQAIVVSTDGTKNIRLAGENSNPHELGNNLAQEAINQGAWRLIQ